MFLTLSVGSFLDGTFITKYLKREIQHLKREVWKSPSSRNCVKKYTLREFLDELDGKNVWKLTFNTVPKSECTFFSNFFLAPSKNDILNIVDKSGTKLEVQSMNRNKESDKISIKCFGIRKIFYN